MDAMPCITCQKSLRDYGKITPDYQWAYCSICGARYEIMAALDEEGHPLKAPDGHNQFFLNPVAPGLAEFYKPGSLGEQNPVPEKSPDLKSIIRKTESVTDFIEAIKNL